MSNPHESHEESSLIKTPTQLIVVIVLAFLIPIAVIFLIIHFVVGSGTPKTNPAMSDKAIAERIAPVGSIPEIEKGTSPLLAAPAPVAAAPAVAIPGAPATPVAAGGDAAKGKTIYEANCVACHATGAANAPKLGDKTAWAPRLKTGIEALYASAIKGKGAMPAKGGIATLADADVKAAVDYLAAQGK